jgi:hypothetical protein
MRIPLLQWTGLLAAPLAWVVQLVVGWGVEEAACGEGGSRWGVPTEPVEAGLTAAAAAVALIGVLSAFVLLRESRRNVFDPRGRVSFMATSGLLASAVFLGLILMGGLGAVVLPECHQG